MSKITDERIADAVLEHYLETAQGATRRHIAARLGVKPQRLNLFLIDQIYGCEPVQFQPPGWPPAWRPSRERLRREIVQLRDAVEMIVNNPEATATTLRAELAKIEGGGTLVAESLVRAIDREGPL